MADELLRVSDVSAGYLGQDVLHGAALTVGQGEVVAVIGSNGAGKTTLFRAVCGLVRPSGGTVHFDGIDITGLATHRASRSGLAYVPAERHLFPTMSVRENLVLGAYPERHQTEQLEFVYELFPRLGERKTQHAGKMSGGEQQMLAVARALMSRPRLLVLDEPTTGLAPKLAIEAYAALGELRRQGLTILVAEQQVPLVLGLADRGYVLDHGRIQLTGTANQLADDPEVRRAYLGVT
ncbi:MAG: ABC transporter ATP-binding protein [Actinobacteria bacterium]|jgi:branched-chain amino acid transport system ATP-binding protein|nr:ABC transporter ATP-binding protein [Actinomycetota bacterium]MBT3686935.1 ABC transporter ATP-binding protein [Actinomycetota bacterium]MBT4036759.1 ABC transporter ATP-binding protein [Actinomycetota bacterium]MBT4278332.1 ABC transporter ATP-binding protein [Actinomycetota bacterium]MBT4342920.1 ABC transporter ATP-binding protein [Actinomycetota bacterium]